MPNDNIKTKAFEMTFWMFYLGSIWPLVVIIQIWQRIPVWRTPHLRYIWPWDVLAGVVWPGLRFDPAAWWPLSLIRPLAVGTTGSGLQPLGRKEKSVPRESLQTILCTVCAGKGFFFQSESKYYKKNSLSELCCCEKHYGGK